MIDSFCSTTVRINSPKWIRACVALITLSIAHLCPSND